MGASIRALTKSKDLWGRTVFREGGSLKMVDSVGDLNCFRAAQKVRLSYDLFIISSFFNGKKNNKVFIQLKDQTYFLFLSPLAPHKPPLPCVLRTLPVKVLQFAKRRAGTFFIFIFFNIVKTCQYFCKAIEKWGMHLSLATSAFNVMGIYIFCRLFFLM